MKKILTLSALALLASTSFVHADNQNEQGTQPAPQIIMNEDGSIDWGNGFTTISGPDGVITSNGKGQSIEVKDGKLQCDKSVNDNQACSFFTAYNSTLVEDMLMRILPAAGDEESSIDPQNGNDAQPPETIVLVDGDIPTIPQVDVPPVVNNTPPAVPVAPERIGDLEKAFVEIETAR